MKSRECKDMEILGEFRFYFLNLGLVDKDGVIRLRIIGLQVSLVKTLEITLHFIMKLDLLFIKPKSSKLGERECWTII